MTDADFLVFLNGTYGAGKSATLDHVGDLLAAAGTAFSLMDVDWFHRSWPPAAGDPDNVRGEAANLAAVWSNYRKSGARRLIVSGVMVTSSDRDRYEDAFELPVRSARLTVDPVDLETRLRRRYSDAQWESLTWHLERHADLTRRLVDADLDEIVIDTTGRPPIEAARRIVQHFAL